MGAICHQRLVPRLQNGRHIVLLFLVERLEQTGLKHWHSFLRLGLLIPVAVASDGTELSEWREGTVDQLLLFDAHEPFVHFLQTFLGLPDILIKILNELTRFDFCLHQFVFFLD